MTSPESPKATFTLDRYFFLSHTGRCQPKVSTTDQAYTLLKTEQHTDDEDTDDNESVPELVPCISE